MLCPAAAHECNNYKGSIYMVFDYMDHDMTGLMERQNYKMPMDQVRAARRSPVHLQSWPVSLVARAGRFSALPAGTAVWSCRTC